MKEKLKNSGDHRNKLQPGIIEELNCIFADILDAFGYTTTGND
jgi:hypothetical protein